MADINQFAGYLKTRLKAVAVKELNYLKKMDTPLLKQFEALSFDQMLAMTTDSLNKFLTSLEQGEQLAYVRQNFEKWKLDDLDYDIPRDAIKIEDFQKVYASQFKAFIDFIPEYTNEVDIAVRLVQELQDFFMKVEHEGVGMVYDALDQSKTELKRSNEELEQFAYVASHDLQEPLNNVTSFAALLHTHYTDQLDERGKKSIRYIVKGVDRMKDLIKGLLEYSRIGHKRTFEPVDCNKVVAAVRSDLATLLQETDTHLTVKQLPTVKGIKIELQSLFQNLLHNAIKFRKKKKAARIQVSAKEKNKNWEFSVEDNGIGIHPKAKDKPFLIFQRLHRAKAYNGTGIGLAHCKKIVEMHKGNIWYHSKPEVGTTFYFTIPKYTP